MPTIDDAMSLYLDAALPAVSERGVGAHLGPAALPWATTNIFTTPDRKGMFLQPIQYDASWRTTTTAGGIWARHPSSDFTASSGTWDQIVQNTATDYWMLLAGTSGSLTTTGTGWTGGASGRLRTNPHLFIEAFLFGPGLSSLTALSVEWGSDAAPYRWKLDVTGMGFATLYEYVGSAYVVRTTDSLFRDGDVTHRPLRLWIAPLYRCGLYIFGRGGDCLIWQDMDRDDGTTDHCAPAAVDPMVPTGTAKVTLAVRGAVQITEAAFQASGTVDASVALGYVPTPTVAQVDSEGNPLHWTDEPTGTDVTITFPGFTPATKALPVHAVLTPSTDRRTTPTLYCAGFHFDATAADRTVGDVSWLDYTLDGLELSSGDGGTTLTLPLKSASSLREKIGRLVILKCGTDEMFRGYAMDPESVLDSSGLDRVTYTCVDEWETLNGTILPGTERFDGMKLTDAIKAVLGFCGRSSADWDIDDNEFRLPSRGSTQTPQTTGGPAAFYQGTDTVSAGDFVRNLASEYLNWVHDFAPVSGAVVFRFKEPYYLWQTPVATLYQTVADAVAAGKDPRYAVREWNQRVIRPEANEILVLGQSPGGKELRARYVDEKSQDPTITEISGLRPANWLGRRVPLALVDANLCTQAAVNAVCAWMKWVTKARLSVSFETDWHPQVRYKDSVTVKGTGGGADHTYVVEEFSGRIVYEGVSGAVVPGNRVRTMSIRAERFLA